ncbi:TMEM165/GDT1 family protein [Halovenus rubra]|uniref:TMEM165/GDT1 family protein n=2 Tax=Halovenus rubra TaxID=869890 RepID=A0ACC7DYK1_9EURY|nr:TMEM165/GDT1 family protein [Halovenus rubra]
MADILTVIVVAAGWQLAVLPGEKVQLIIASLSTRYHPLLVVSAAGTAFAGWTALEILFGNALQNTIPGVYLDLITVVLFALFAVLLWRSMPEQGTATATTDGGGLTAASELDVTLFGQKVPNVLGGFVPIFAMMAAGEFGDKTQLITITLAAQFGASPGIWIGEMLVIIPVSLANAYFFYTFSNKIDIRKAHMFGAGLFVFFAADTLLAVVTGFSIWETAVDQIAGAITSLY